MADITPAKTWGNEDLFPADLNTEFTNVYANHVSKSTAQTISGVKTFSAGPILQDSVNLTFGTGSDATIDYDGTNLVIQPAVVGTGSAVIRRTDNAAASVLDAAVVEWDPGDAGNLTDTSSGLAIAFKLPDDADNQDVMGRVQLIVNDDASGSEDTEWQFMRMVAGSLTAQSLGTTINNATENELVTVASTTTELDAESNLTWDGTSMGVGIASPDGTLHVHTGSAGSVAAATNADDLVVEVTSGQNGGISILSGASDIANLTFGSPTSNEEAYVRYDHNNGKMILSADRSGSAGSLNLLGGPMVGLQDDANANMTIGITINQGGNDNEILALKSSDVAHGLTSQAETDTFLSIRKNPGASGGANIRILKDDTTWDGAVAAFDVAGGAALATQTTGGVGLFDILVREHDGSNSFSNMTADGVVFTVRARDNGGNTYTKFLVDEDGDIKYDGSDAGAFDIYEDAHLVRATSRAISPDVVMGKFDEMVKYDSQTLMDLGILSKCTPEDFAAGHRPMVSVGGCTRMLVGAAWQGYVRDMELAEQVEALKAQNALLESRLNLLEN